MEDISKDVQIAIAQAVGKIAQELQENNDHNGVQYALASAFCQHEIMTGIEDIDIKASHKGYMPEYLISHRNLYAKQLAKHIKNNAPFAYEELLKYNVMSLA